MYRYMHTFKPLSFFFLLLQARSLLSPILSPMMLFCGFVLPHSAMPSWIAWAYYLSFLQYALSVLQISHLQDKVFTRDCPAQLVGT